MTPDIDLDALTALLARTEAAPWTAEYDAIDNMWLVHSHNMDIAKVYEKDDALLFCAARNQLPALLSALTAARAELDDLRDASAVQRDDLEHVMQAARELRAELDAMTGVAKALRITVEEMLSGKQHTRARTLTWESTLKYATEALANPADAPQPDDPGHCGLCGCEDCPGIPGKGCTPGPHETATLWGDEDAADAPCKTCGQPWRNRRHQCSGTLGLIAEARASVALDGETQTLGPATVVDAGAGDGEQDTSTTCCEGHDSECRTLPGGTPIYCCGRCPVLAAILAATTASGQYTPRCAAPMGLFDTDCCGEPLDHPRPCRSTRDIARATLPLTARPGWERKPSTETVAVHDCGGDPRCCGTPGDHDEQHEEGAA